MALKEPLPGGDQGWRSRPDVKGRCGRPLRQTVIHGKRDDYLKDIYAGLTDNEFRRYQQRYPEESSSMAGVIQRARDEGIRQGLDEGIRQGRDEGIRQGRAEVLAWQLRRRFGLLPPDIVARLHKASAAELETWAENVLDAETLDEVFDNGP